MKRNSWEFQYKVKDLLEAAKARMAFYESRVAFWESKKTETIEKIKSEGITIDESLAARDGKAAYSNFAGRGGQVVIRDDLERDLSEAHGRVASHRKNVATYEAWVEILSSQHQDQVRELNHDDWLFFFSKKS